MTPRMLRIGDVVTREADGQRLELRHHGHEIGAFRARELETNEMVDINIREIDFEQGSDNAGVKKRNSAEPDLEDFAAEQIAKAKLGRSVVERFNLNLHRTTQDALECASKLEISVAQFYRVRSQYNGSLRSLIPQKPNGGRGNSRLGDVRAKILKRCIKKYYVRDDPEIRERVCEEVWKRCDKLHLPRISASTIYRGMLKVPPFPLAKNKYGHTEAKNQFGPAPGKYAEGTEPLSLVQIDHTPLDLFLVDDKGDEVGRAWLTLAIDVFSRMIVGLYLSYEDPGTTTVAMVIYRSVIPKDDYLKGLRVRAKWPCWGKMQTVHADNGPDFRNQNLKDACEEHHIDLHWRPLGDPMYGGHIENLAKRVNQEVKKLNGRISSDFKQRKHEKPEKNGIFTLNDAERYLVTWITQVYHFRRHKGINMRPIDKYIEGLHGGDRPIGDPVPPSNPTQILLDMLPSEWRTVQRDGIEIDNVKYYAPVLARFIGLRDPKNRKLPRKYRCRKPIDDARVIYFQDPDSKVYHKIHCADRTMPPMSRRDLLLINTTLRKKGILRINTTEIKRGYSALEAIRRQVLAKASKSSKARKIRRQQASNATATNSAAPMPHRQTPPVPSTPVTKFTEDELPDFTVVKGPKK